MCERCDGATDEELRAKTLANIMEHGHQVVAVPEGVDRFAYSQGRCLVDKAEFVVAGPLSPQLMMHMINRAAKIADEEEVGDGYVFEPDVLLGNHPVRVVEVDPKKSRMFQTIYMAEASGDITVRALQLVWPDLNGNFPDDPGYDQRFVQPIYPVSEAS